MNKCTCTEQEVKKYMEKISGPLIDRIDLCVHMNQVTYFQLEKEEQHLMEKIYTTMDLSIRAYDKIIKVARTIADLKQHEKIQQGDIAEAVSYRPVLFK